MQAGGIDDVPDFLPESFGNPVKADFQSLDDRPLLGQKLPFLSYSGREHC